jgi:hypothetical protein
MITSVAGATQASWGKSFFYPACRGVAADQEVLKPVGRRRNFSFPNCGGDSSLRFKADRLQICTAG